MPKPENAKNDIKDSPTKPKKQEIEVKPKPPTKCGYFTLNDEETSARDECEKR